VSPDLRLERRNALLSILEAEQLDGLIVTHLPNVRYLTGFSGTAGVTVVLREATIFFTDFRYRTQADSEVGDTARIEIVGSDMWTRVFEVLREYPRSGTLGYESHHVTVHQAGVFSRGDVPFRSRAVGELVERLRIKKHPSEISALRAAAQLAVDALSATLQGVRVGQREFEIAATLESELRRRGSEWHPFQTIVASGPRSALPHARTGDRAIQQGDFLLIDFGAELAGYCSDITRTVTIGQASERQRAVYDLVREAQLTACRGIRAGMSGRDADALARTLIETRGFGDAFGHSLGHGLGLEVHEAPRVSKANEAPLPEHAVVTIEPGIYVPGWGGVRIEDDVYLAPGGPELLTDGRTELVEL
jgi:Xaa-Pro aminopeptidase